MSANDHTRDGHTSSPTWRKTGPVPRTLKRAACTVFISYAHADESDRAQLEAHLAPLIREGLIEVWHDRVIKPGADWAGDIEHHLTTADVVLLLVSASFIASIFCFEKELAEALRRHEDDGVHILPVIVKPVDFSKLPFARFQALPRNFQPVSTWTNVDSAWLDVALGVRQIVEELHGSRAALPAQRIAPPAEPDKTSLGQQLDNYYGQNSCVIDGTIFEDGRVELIPLDGNSSNMRFENLIPLNRRHRVRQLRLAGGPIERPSFRFGFDLTAENLLHRSRQHFHEGRPALAFGCTRLGDALTDQYPDAFETEEDDGWAFLSLCLFYLPYRMHCGLLEATLLRVRYRLALTSTCPYGRRSALLLSVANIYQDIGDWPRAEQLYNQVLQDKLTTFTEAATRRRRTIGQFFTGSSDRSVDEDFRRIAEYKTGIDFPVSLAISRGWWHLARGRPEECLRLLEPFDFEDETELSAYHPHNAFELKLTQASARNALGLSYRSQITLVELLARRCVQTRLRPVFTDQIAPKVLAPQLINIIKPLGSAMVVTPSLLAELDATAGALLAARGTDIAGRPTWVD